jgi:hypothetical protein
MLLKASGVDQEIGKEKRNRILNWVYGITLGVWIVSYSVWNSCGVNTFYIGTALTVLGLCIVIHASGIVVQWLSSFGCFVAINNLLDEILFTPWEFNLTEYIVGGLALIYYYKKYRIK